MNFTSLPHPGAATDRPTDLEDGQNGDWIDGGNDAGEDEGVGGEELVALHIAHRAPSGQGVQ